MYLQIFGGTPVTIYYRATAGSHKLLPAVDLETWFQNLEIFLSSFQPPCSYQPQRTCRPFMTHQCALVCHAHRLNISGVHSPRTRQEQILFHQQHSILWQSILSQCGIVAQLGQETHCPGSITVYLTSSSIARGGAKKNFRHLKARCKWPLIPGGGSKTEAFYLTIHALHHAFTSVLLPLARMVSKGWGGSCFHTVMMLPIKLDAPHQGMWLWTVSHYEFLHCWIFHYITAQTFLIWKVYQPFHHFNCPWLYLFHCPVVHHFRAKLVSSQQQHIFVLKYT